MSKALVQTLLQDGMAAAKQGNVELARQSFAKVVQHDPKHEYGWLWLALVVDSTEQAIYCLNRVLELNPTNERAQNALEHLKETAGASTVAPLSAAPAEVTREDNDKAVEVNDEEPDTAELQEISKEATLVAQAETAEVKSFKKRIATGPLPGTGSLSLSDEWLPPDLLAAQEPEAPTIDEPMELEFTEGDLDDFPEVDFDFEEPATIEDEQDSTLVAPVPEVKLNGNLNGNGTAPTLRKNGSLPETAPLQAPPAKPRPVIENREPQREVTPPLAPPQAMPAPVPTPAFAQDTPSSEPPAEPTTISKPTGPNILVVDDSQTVRRLVKITLDRLGFNVIEAKDGFEALAQLANQVPDLILLDITMPRMDGYQVCRIIKENGSTRHIPVIMLSGKDGFFDKVKGRLAGATDYVTKPFEPGALYTSIQSNLEKRR